MSNLWICRCESSALSEHHSPGCICGFLITRRSERCLFGLATLTEEETQKYVADSVVTSECWLTRYEKPVKIQKLWLVGGEVVLWPYIVDGVVYNYPIVRNSIWADSKTLPDPEFQNQIMDITQKWLNEA